MPFSARQIGILAIFLVIVLYGGNIWDSFDNWIQTSTVGPEYCLEDIAQSQVAVASQGGSVSYTKIEGDNLCFRTKDTSIIERLNEQIQDRKLQEELAKTETIRQFWNETFPKLFIFTLIAVVLIILIISLSNKNQGRYY
jgi:hypothetical protein